MQAGAGAAMGAGAMGADAAAGSSIDNLGTLGDESLANQAIGGGGNWYTNMSPMQRAGFNSMLSGWQKAGQSMAQRGQITPLQPAQSAIPSAAQFSTPQAATQFSQLGQPASGTPASSTQATISQSYTQSQMMASMMNML